MKYFLPFVCSMHFCWMAAQDSLLVAALKEHSSPFSFNAGVLAGEGFDFLYEEAAKSPFFLIGEDHGIAEIPLFTAALFRQVRELDYHYFATETGPFTATLLEDMASAGEWKEQFRAFYRSFPFSIPFYSWWEECEILQSVLKNRPSEDPVIWGLDQEFAGSFRMFFQKLEEEATSDEARALAKTYFDLAQKTFQEMMESRNPANSMLTKLKPTDFERLKTTFTGQPEAIRLIRELEESLEIYQLWFVGEGHRSNHLRAEMMKRHFWEYYREAIERDPELKIMFKFGANHIYRGLNGTNVYDIGNFVSELASQQGKSSFHLYVIGRKGTQNAYTPFSKEESDRQKTYDPRKYLDRIDFNPVLDATSDADWSVLDLRPLRKLLHGRQIREVDEGLRRLIFSYDAVLVIPEVHAAASVE